MELKFQGRPAFGKGITMEKDMSIFAEDLTVRANLYNAFYVLFGSEPAPETIEVLSGEAVREAAELLFDKDTAKVIGEFSVAVASYDEQREGHSLADCYTRLFIGPNPPEAAPWESVYDKEDGYLFGKTTLAVRKAYVESNLIPHSYPNVADDHLALELDFVKHLAYRASDACALQDVEGFKKSLQASVSFVENHILKFIEPFTACLEKSAYGKVYFEGAKSLHCFLKADCVLVKKLLTDFF